MNPVQFGKLVLREKSIRTVGGEEALKEFRSAKKYYKDLIETLDKAGIDIEVKMTHNPDMGEEKGKSLVTTIFNKNREQLTGIFGETKTRPWYNMTSILTHAFSVLNIQQAEALPPMKISGKFTQSGQDEIIRVKTKGRGISHPKVRKDIEPGTAIDIVR